VDLDPLRFMIYLSLVSMCMLIDDRVEFDSGSETAVNAKRNLVQGRV
jgi:hypothetical protein